MDVLDVLEEIKEATFASDCSNESAVKFKELAEEVFDRLVLKPYEERSEAVDFLIETFIQEVGERPPGASMNVLGHILAWDYMEGDTRSSKSRLQEYPIFTESQYRRRTQGQGTGSSTAVGESYREVYFDTELLASDGRDYRIPVRRYS